MARIATLEIEGIQVGYGEGEPVLSDFSLSLASGEFLALLGPSGCGKTTALRTVLGFLRPDQGKILLEGKDYTELPPYKRNFGIVYQSYALFPHLSVYDNVAFGLRMRKMDRKKIERKVHEWLDRVGLKGFEERTPGRLSGGQQQRVALARVLAVEPDILLLDEPLSNLDAKLRTEMRIELQRIQNDLGITTIYVTHDQLEALSMADRVALLNQGDIEQLDSPEGLYHNPATPFVADFMGYENEFKAEISSIEKKKARFKVDDIILQGRVLGEECSGEGEMVRVFFHPEAPTIFEEEPEGPNIISFEVGFTSFQGHLNQYLLKTPIGEFKITGEEKELSRDFKHGFLSISPNDLLVYLEKD